jgi:hypothetical protein
MDTDKLVDDVFESGFDQFGKVRTAEKEIDILLEKIKDEIDFGKGSLSTTGRPYDHPIKARVVPSVDGKAKVSVDECVGPTMNEERFEGSEYDEDAPAKEDDSRKLANVINTVPNQNVGGLLKSIHRQLAEMRVNEDYKTYFKSMLKKHGYDSPANIPADKKKEFFNAVDKGWKGKGEVSEGFKEMRCRNINKEIVKSKAVMPKHKANCQKKAKGDKEKLAKCIKLGTDTILGLEIQKKKWGC